MTNEQREAIEQLREWLVNGDPVSTSGIAAILNIADTQEAELVAAAAREALIKSAVESYRIALNDWNKSIGMSADVMRVKVHMENAHKAIANLVLELYPREATT